jgi:hypothetical protein
MTEKKALTGLIVICTLLASTVRLPDSIAGKYATADLPIMSWSLGFGAAELLSIPVANYLLTEWLGSFAYRIAVGWWSCCPWLFSLAFVQRL